MSAGKSRLWSLVPLVLAFTISRAVWAQDLSFEVSVPSRQVRVGEAFDVTCSISSSGDIDDIEVPDTGTLDQLGTSRSEGSQVSIVNGQLSASRTVRITLRLLASAPGTYTISSGQVRSGDKVAQSQVLKIEALANSTSPNREQSEADTTASVPKPASGFENIFAALSVDRDDVFLGEQISATLTLYSRVQLSDIRNVRWPDFEGVVMQELESPQRVTGHSKTLGGRRYKAYMLRRIALFPTRAGTLTLAPASVGVVSGGGFFDPGRNITVDSEAVEIHVRALPIAGQPPRFNSGNVGRYRLEVSVSSKRISTRDPVTLRVAVTGAGNIRSVQIPEVGELDGFRVFHPTPFEDIRVKDGGIFGSKGYEVLLTPKRSGKLTIPSLSLPYFDPNTQAYEKSASPALFVEATGALAAAAPQTDAATSTALLSASRPVRLNPRLAPRQQALSLVFYYTLVAALVAGMLTMLMLGRLRIARTDSRDAAQRRVFTQAKERMQRALQGSDGAEIVRALHHLIEQCAQVKLLGLTREAGEQLLQQRGMDADLAARIVDFEARIEAMRYAPVAAQTDGRSATDARRIVQDVLAWFDTAHRKHA